MDILNYGEESVSVAIKEVKSEGWLKKVYEPDIRANWAELYKKPGYGPSDLE
jgi:4-oxalocrotonate tautomerase